MAIGTRKGMVRRTRKNKKRIGRPAYTGLKPRRKSTKASPLYRKLEGQKLALQRRLKKMRADGKSNPTKGKRVLWNTSGGALAGVANATFPTVPGINASTPLVIGSILVIGGLMGRGKWAGEAAAIGAGMLSKYIGDVSEGFVSTGTLELMAPAGENGDVIIEEEEEVLNGAGLGLV